MTVSEVIRVEIGSPPGTILRFSHVPTGEQIVAALYHGIESVEWKPVGKDWPWGGTSPCPVMVSLDCQRVRRGEYRMFREPLYAAT